MVTQRSTTLVNRDGMTPHRMTGTTTTATPTTPTPPPTPRSPSTDLSGLGWVIVFGDRLDGLSPPSRPASEEPSQVAERPNRSDADFLRHVGGGALALRSYRVSFETPKRNFSRSLRTAENSHFDSEHTPLPRIRILIREHTPTGDFGDSSVTTRLAVVALTEVFPDDVLPWRSRAACRTTQSEVFYPMGTSPPAADIDAAKQVCRRCPVSDECLDAADDFGIWGGFTAAERRRLDLL